MREQLLTADCSRCRGLCCTELCFSKCDGFPADKPAGRACTHLTADFRCDIHGELARRGLRGCLAYDCFGAGQRAAETGEDFHVLFRLHQILWYLNQAAELEAARDLWPQVAALLAEQPDPDGLDDYQDRANGILKKIIPRVCVKGRPNRGDLMGKQLQKQDLSEMDYSFTLLIAADLTGCRLRGTSLLGADLRDAVVRGADLSGALFLTQRQVNSAKGDRTTRLPGGLAYPTHWNP